jgi:S1-C subfamily serine protease
MLFRFLNLIFVFTLSLFAENSVKDSIVKIYTVSKVPNYSIPWNSSIRRSHGSGSIISGNRILTNAHVVANETFIEVKRYGKTQRYEAELEFISHQADLALLRVKDKSFFEGSKALELGDLPKIQQKITVYGFPMGGNSLSASTGIVSRIEHNRYAHSREIFLSIQIDAAVNPGSSGGPAISDGKIVGIVMQQIKKSQNLGYLVPTQIVKHFLKDVEDGKYDGFAHIGVSSIKMENEALREVYKMSKETSGIMLMDISEVSSVYNTLKDGDILLSIDGHRVQNDGTIEFMPEQFTSYMYYIDQKQIGDSVELEVLRDAKTIKLEIKLENIADDDLLVDTLEHDVMPKYLIYGGYVFSPLSRNLLIQSRSTPLELKMAAGEWATKQKEEIVVLLKVLADSTNRGDHSFRLWKVDKIDGKSFKNFAEFKKILQSYKGKYLLLENKSGVKIAIDTQKAKDAQERILKRYSIKNMQDGE